MRSLLAAFIVVCFIPLSLAAAEPQPGKNAEKKPDAKPTGATKMPAKDDAVAQVDSHIEKLKSEGKINKDAKAWKTSLPRFPELKFSQGKTYHWHLDTNQGDIKVKLLPAVAPQHVANFIYLSQLGFFDGIEFHRVITGFMAQGGDPTGTGSGSPGYRFGGEFDPKVKHDKPGILSMANAGPNTDGSQFFLTFVPTPHLDGKHTIFGEVAEGKETLKELEKRGSSSGKTSEKLLIEKAWVTVE